MVSEKVIVILIVVAIILSIVSVAVTISAAKPIIPSTAPQPKVVYNFAPPEHPDTQSARVGIVINKPTAPAP